MNYTNSEMKIDQLVGYLNDQKINLSPAFQRGHVWKPKIRRKLLLNIVERRPIPAIFLYKEASGTKYSYNILDGKQRLESLILFIASSRADFRIPKWTTYFAERPPRLAADFAIDLPEGRKTFRQLTDARVRDFREYTIPTVEITLDDDSSLDEIISLFVDINQQGVEVKRFDIVKAMCKADPLLKSVFALIATEQQRGQDVLYKSKSNEFTSVLKRLQVVQRIGAANARVDKMWELLLELAVFCRNKVHRKPVEILKEFVRPGKASTPKLTASETAELRRTFRFLRPVLAKIPESRLATDQTHLYTLVTAVLREDLTKTFGEAEAIRKVKAFAQMLEAGPSAGTAKAIRDAFKIYTELAEKQTTDASRRTEREKQVVAILKGL